MLWRRSYDTPPPPLDVDDEYSQFHDPRYAMLPPEARPRTECLADVVARLLPYWYDEIVPDLRAGWTVLVAAHGNSLRALIKHLDGMSEEAVVALNVPTGIPLRYDLDDDLRPRTPGGAYLDPDAAAVAIAAVAAKADRSCQAAGTRQLGERRCAAAAASWEASERCCERALATRRPGGRRRCAAAVASWRRASSFAASRPGGYSRPPWPERRHTSIT